MAKTAILKPFLAVATDKMKANTVAELQARTEFKEGDVVEVLGELVAGDGKHHMRIASTVADASGVQGQNGLFWNVVPNSLINLIAQALADTDAKAEQNKSDILLKVDKSGGTIGYYDIGNIINSNKLTTDSKQVINADLQSVFVGNLELDDLYLQCNSGNILHNGKDLIPKPVFTGHNCPLQKASNGWCQLANGLLVQWGEVRTVDGESVINLPITFSGDYKIVATSNVNNSNIYPVSLTRVNGSTVNLYAFIYIVKGHTLWTAALSDPVQWIAIGF